LKREIDIIKRSLEEKIVALIEQGIDLDEIFHDVKETDDLKWQFDNKIEV
jgi:hypothetical protein